MAGTSPVPPRQEQTVATNAAAGNRNFSLIRPEHAPSVTIRQIKKACRALLLESAGKDFCSRAHPGAETAANTQIRSCILQITQQAVLAQTSLSRGPLDERIINFGGKLIRRRGPS